MEVQRAREQKQVREEQMQKEKCAATKAKKGAMQAREVRLTESGVSKVVR